MTGKSHMTIGICAVLGAQAATRFVGPVQVGPVDVPAGVMLVGAVAAAVVGALVPDIDHATSSATGRVWGRGLVNATLGGGLRALLGGHRALTHSLWVLVALTVGAALAWKLWPALWGPLAVGFALGYVCHIAADMLTKEGVKLFWPVLNMDIGIGPRLARFKTGTLMEYAVVLLVAAATGAAWMWTWRN